MNTEIPPVLELPMMKIVEILNFGDLKLKDLIQYKAHHHFHI